MPLLPNFSRAGGPRASCEIDVLRRPAVHQTVGPLMRCLMALTICSHMATV